MFEANPQDYSRVTVKIGPSEDLLGRWFAMIFGPAAIALEHCAEEHCAD